MSAAVPAKSCTGIANPRTNANPRTIHTVYQRKSRVVHLLVRGGLAFATAAFQASARALRTIVFLAAGRMTLVHP